MRVRLSPPPRCPRRCRTNGLPPARPVQIAVTLAGPCSKTGALRPEGKRSGSRAAEKVHHTEDTSLDTCANCHNDGAIKLRGAFDEPSAGDEGGNLKMYWHRADSFRRKATRPWVNFIEIESEPNIDPFGFQILGADCGSNAAPSHNKICQKQTATQLDFGALVDALGSMRQMSLNRR
jgi:hypothetical protein